MRFLLTHSGTPLAKGIRWFTRGHFSHVAMLFSDDTVIEAVWPRVRKLTFNDWAKEMGEGEEYKIFTLDTDKEEGIRAYAEAQVGKPYDIIGDLHFVTRQDYPTQPDSEWFCSEVAFESCWVNDVLLFARTRGQDVSPDMFSRSPLLV